MSDLTERLRALSRSEHDDLSVAGEAAAEIERLTEEIEKMQTYYTNRIQRMTDEIEELESTLSEYATKSYNDFFAGMKAAAQRCAEIANEYCRDSEGYHSGCDTEDKILEEFGLEE